MPEICPECGAPVPEGGSCRDNFHALLLREAEVPGATGSVLHFYAVAAYGLQHPDSMNYNAAALAGLRSTLADALDGRLTVSGIRRRTRRAVDGPARVTRRRGEAEVLWRRGGWPMTVVDVGAADAEEYADRVLRWAHSVRDTLDGDFARAADRVLGKNAELYRRLA
jgi:hypothetical protein